MLSWISRQLPRNGEITAPSDDNPVELMKYGLSFDAVLTPGKEHEYRDMLARISRTTYEQKNRYSVLDSLHYGLAPKNPEREWRTIFNGLRILNSLIDHGSLEIFREVSEGQHFDLLQKSLFLLSFCHSDERVTKLIRTAAREIRDKLSAKFNEIEEQPSEVHPPPISASGISSEDAFHLKQNPVVTSSFSHLVSLRHIESDEDGSDRLDGNPTSTLETPQLPDLL